MNFIHILTHEFSHGITAILVGSHWDALYMNPTSGFIFSRSSNDISRILITVSGTLGIVIVGILFNIIQKHLKNKNNATLIRLVLISFTFTAAIEPLTYWMTNTILYIVSSEGDFGDPGSILDYSSDFYIITAIFIIIISIIIAIILLPKFFNELFDILYKDNIINIQNPKFLMYTIFLSNFLLKGVLICIINTSFSVLTIFNFLLYGYIISKLGFILVMINNFSERISIKRLKIRINKNEINNIQKTNIHEYNIWFSKKSISFLFIGFILVSSSWLGMFGISEEKSIGLNWNEDPAYCNIEFNLDEDKIGIIYRYHPEFPAQLRDRVFNWENYLNTSIIFSNVLIGTNNIESSDYIFDISSDKALWALNKTFINSRIVKLKEPITFNEIENLSIDGDFFTYNITDPWQYYSPNSFIDEIEFNYNSSSYQLISIDFFKNYKSVSHNLFSNDTGKIIIRNYNPLNSPLIYQFEFKKL